MSYFFLLKILESCTGATERKSMETIISAAVSAAATLVVCLINNVQQARQTRNLLDYKLEELTRRVDKHNSVIERTYALEKRAEVQEEQIKVANHRIQDLETEVK